jgi:hypothetical protein
MNASRTFLRFLVTIAFISPLGFVAACVSPQPIANGHGAPVTINPATGAVELVDVSKVVTVVKRALEDAQKKIHDEGNELPPLESVTLTLQTTSVTTDGITFKIYVIGVGTTAEITNTEQLTLKLTPPPPDVEHPIGASGDLYQNLVDTIVAAAKASHQASSAAAPTLLIDSVGAQVAFGIKETKTGNLGIDIKPIISIGPSGSLAQQASNKIDLSFKKPGGPHP